MAEMLELEDGGLVPFRAVQALRPVGPDRHDPSRWEVIGLGGARIGRAFPHDVEPLRGALLPATPGWRFCHYSDQTDPDFGLSLEPVIAWRFRSERPTPITANGPPVSACWVVVAPDGHTTEPETGNWDSLEQAEKDLRARWEAARAEAKGAA